MFRPRSKWPTLAALALLTTACRGLGEGGDTQSLALNGTSVHIRPTGYSHPPIQIEWNAATRTFEITPPPDLPVSVSATFNSTPLELTPDVVNTVRFDTADGELRWTATNHEGHTESAICAYASAPRRAPFLSSFTSTSTTRTARLWVYFGGYRTSFFVTQQTSPPTP